MCRFELRSTHVISIYVTSQPGKFKRKYIIWNLSIHVISIYVTFQPGTFSKLGGCVVLN